MVSIIEHLSWGHFESSSAFHLETHDLLQVRPAWHDHTRPLEELDDKDS